MKAVSFQEKIRLSQARQFGQMLAQFWAMEPEDRINVLNAANQFPTHPGIADNDEAIMTIAEAFWPDMKDS